MDNFLDTYLIPGAWIIGGILAIVVPLLVAVAYATYMERKVLASMHWRRGPNVTGPMGLLQPFADGAKLLLKETVFPSGSSKAVFLIAPMLTFILALVAWAVIPFSAELVLSDINVGVLYLLAISSLGVYGIIMAGWASNSKYAFLGAMRSAAQMVSYEVSMGLIIINVLLVVGSLNLNDIVMAQANGGWFGAALFNDFGLFGENGGWFMFSALLPMGVMFFISTLAETNRAPFDLPEAEAELVAGYMVEYSSFPFALFFLGEYANMLLMGAMTSILFLGGWLPPFEFLDFIPGPIWLGLKIALMMYMFIWVRATFPRYRYDQLMRLGWKVFLPLSLFWVVLTAGWLVATGRLPNMVG